MKAWKVEPKGGIDWAEVDIEEAEPIVHAETRAQAIARSGLWVNGHYVWTELRAKRAPSFDAKPLTDRTYLEAGWYITCHGCGDVTLTSDGPVDWNDEDYDDPPGVAYDDEDHAYCSTHCRDESMGRHARMVEWRAKPGAQNGEGDS